MKVSTSPPYLKWKTPEGRELTLALTADEVVIGRKSDADIVLPNPYVSRQHARLIKDAEGYRLVDLRSTHGTYVNGQRVEMHKLQFGDRISVGQDRLELLYLARTANTTRIEIPEVNDFEKSFIQLASILPAESSDLEKISSVLDFQYQWGKSFSSEKTFQQILRAALKVSGAERGFILLKQGDEFEYVVGLDGKGRRLSPSDFRTSRTVVHRVANGGEAVFMSEGLAGDLARQESIVAMNLMAIACLPLRWISANADTPEVQGILYLDSTKGMHVLTGLDQKILTKLALEAGNVFEKLEMIEGFEQRKILEQELSLAQETQKTILPHSVPHWQNFRVHAFNQPTRYLGGDFYDFLNLSGGEWAGVLADVSGKGISASLLGSLLQGALHMQCRSTAGLEEALNHINRFFSERTSSERFVTLFLFALNLNGEGRFINAGHTTAYLYRARSKEIEPLESGGLILGAFDFATYQSCPLKLNQGDILVVYSDGVTEAQDPKGEMFGEERLIQLIKEKAPSGGEALEKGILQSIQEFTQDMAQTDDITFLLVERDTETDSPSTGTPHG
jgi:serine phosphatase RsbU (regulator of sigma subunit)